MKARRMNVFDELNKVIDRAIPQQAYSDVMEALLENFTVRDLVRMLECSMSTSERDRLHDYFAAINAEQSQEDINKDEGAWLDSQR